MSKLMMAVTDCEHIDYTQEREICEANGIGFVKYDLKEEAEAAEIETFVESKFGGSLPAFVAAFTKHQDMSEQDLDEVQRMIDRIRKGGK